jgi:hypothetical protein
MVTFVAGATVRWALGSVILLTLAWALAGFCDGDDKR